MPTTQHDDTDDRLSARVAALEATVAALTAENTALRATVAKQDALLRKYQAMLFGTKSEKGPPGVTATPVDTETSPAAQPADPPPPPRPPSTRGQRCGAPGHGRRLYEELPPREVLHDLPAEERRCPTCGESYLACGSEDATEVEWEVTIQRVIHRRLKYRSACACQAPVLLTARRRRN